MSGLHFVRSAAFGVRFGRTCLFLAVVGVLLLSGGGAGATSLGGFGTTGRYSFGSAPRCGYGASHIARVTVSPPQMFARDITAQVDHQKVAYSVSLLKPDGRGGHTVVVAGPTQTAFASDTTAASFQTFTFERVRAYGDGTYAIGITMHWYPQVGAPDRPEGAHSERLDVYRLTQIRSGLSDLLKATVTGGCPWLKPF